MKCLSCSFQTRGWWQELERIKCHHSTVLKSGGVRSLLGSAVLVAAHFGRALTSHLQREHWYLLFSTKHSVELKKVKQRCVYLLFIKELETVTWGQEFTIIVQKQNIPIGKFKQYIKEKTVFAMDVKQFLHYKPFCKWKVFLQQSCTEIKIREWLHIYSILYSIWKHHTQINPSAQQCNFPYSIFTASRCLRYQQ